MEEISHQVKDFQSAVKMLEELSHTVGSRLQQANEPLTAPQQAAQYLAVARAIALTYSLLLRSQGLDSKEHPIQHEFERLRHYSRKVQKLQSADYLARHRPSVTLNIAAASRFIDNAVPDLSTQQKAALRQVGKQQRPDPDVSEEASPADMARAFLEQTLGAKRGKS